MKLLADENIDRPIVERLRQEGHLVEYVAEMDPGISDDIVLERARQQGLVLLTSDRDFGELVFRQKLASAGVILIRLSGLSLPTCQEPGHTPMIDTLRSVRLPLFVISEKKSTTKIGLRPRSASTLDRRVFSVSGRRR